MGYEVVDGREVETSHYLFDALNMPPTHPTRSPLQTFFLNGDVVIRTETSPEQIHTMERRPPPIYMVSLGRVYRRDTIDRPTIRSSTRSRALPSTAASRGRRPQGHAAAPDPAPVRRGPGGALPDELLPVHGALGRGRPLLLRLQQGRLPGLQVRGLDRDGGAGVVDPNVLEFVGYDPEEVSGFAFGWGARAHRPAPPRGARHPRALGGDLRVIRQF